MDNSQSTQRRTIISVVLITVIGLVLYFGLLKLSQQNETAVRINVLPKDTKVTINGKESFKGSKTVYLSPGTYKVELSAEGFKTSQDDVQVEDFEINEYYTLSPNSVAAEAWYRENQEAVLEFEGKTAEQAREESARFRQRNTVTSVLPYRSVLYSIEYRAEGNNGVVVQILADTPEYRMYALDKIRSFGFEPTDLKIEFTAPFANAFEEGEDDESEHND